MSSEPLHITVGMSPDLRKRLDSLVKLAYSRGRADALLELAVTKAPKNDPATKAAARKRYAKTGVSLPDGSFPIPDRRHLFMAMQAIGRAKDKAKALAHIRRRAAALGLSNNERVRNFFANQRSK